MVNISTLHPGDMVKIVDKWNPGCDENIDGEMDHWLGKTMTVREVYDGYVKMEEDIEEHGGGRGWFWYPDAIECVVRSASSSLGEDEQEFLTSFLAGKKKIHCTSLEERQKCIRILLELGVEVQEELKRGRFKEFLNLGVQHHDDHVVAWRNAEYNAVPYKDFISTFSDTELQVSPVDIVSFLTNCR